MIAVNHFAVIVDQHEVRSANLREVHAERVGPEPVVMFRIARGNVAGDAFIESEAREQAECACEVNFAMAALFFGGGESGRPRQILDSSGCFDHRDRI